PQLSPLVITGPHFGGALATEAPIEPWPSVGPNVTGHSLLQNLTAERHVRYVFDYVKSIDTSEWPFSIVTGRGKVIFANSVIIATGRLQSPLYLEGERSLAWGPVAIAGTIGRYGRFFGRRLSIIGNTTTAAVEALRSAPFAKHVTIVCATGAMTCGPLLMRRLSRVSNLTIMNNSLINSYVTVGSVPELRLRAIELDGAHGSLCLRTDNVVLAALMRPSTSMFPNVKRSASGYILTRWGGPQTNVEGLFASGSAVQGNIKNAINAAASGCNAAEAAIRFLDLQC
ncbi:MAG: NAD(P)/FAD-dependent oxidoreductase, partial [Candidatus Hodgkinia cicadicola]